MSRPMHAPVSFPPVVFECSACGTVHNAQGHHIPVGWSASESQAWCTDCTRAGVPALVHRQPRPARRRQAA